jgi:hypothetical protein
MARAYREQEDAPGIAEMGFDERLAAHLLTAATCSGDRRIVES